MNTDLLGFYGILKINTKIEIWIFNFRNLSVNTEHKKHVVYLGNKH